MQENLSYDINNLPIKYLENMNELLSGKDFESLINSYSSIPTQGIIINKKKISTILLNKFIDGLDLTQLDRFTYEIHDKDYLLKNEKIGKNIYHHLGCFYVSEPSAMSIVPKLEIKEYDKVLDMCAAPGGKSVQSLMYLNEAKGGILYANEIISSRCKILSSNLERIGIGNTVILNTDPMSLKKKFYAYFDKIIVDAPCSGEGMFRKYPYAIDEWSNANVNMCSKRQKEIVACAMPMLKEGGLLSYSTCTFERSEDEDIRDFILENKEFTLVYEEKIFPFMNKGEGQYFAIFKKSCKGAYEDFSEHQQNNIKNKISDKFKSLYLDFERAYLKKTLVTDNKYISVIGDNIYLSNKTDISLDENWVYKNGILLGCVEKNTFTPSHALSHYIDADNFINKIDLESDIEIAEKYILGQEIRINKGSPYYNPLFRKGYILICYNNLGIGFGKASMVGDNYVIKNHYPKGLRNL